jgi:hypothetical protein
MEFPPKIIFLKVRRLGNRSFNHQPWCNARNFPLNQRKQILRRQQRISIQFNLNSQSQSINQNFMEMCSWKNIFVYFFFHISTLTSLLSYLRSMMHHDHRCLDEMHCIMIVFIFLWNFRPCRLLFWLFSVLW